LRYHVTRETSYSIWGKDPSKEEITVTYQHATRRRVVVTLAKGRSKEKEILNLGNRSGKSGAGRAVAVQSL